MPSGFNEVKLSDCLTIRHGKSQRDVEITDGKFPILGTGGEIGRTDTALYSKPSVLIGRKGTIDKPRYMDTPFWTVDTLFYTEIKDHVVPKYIFYVFNTIDWYKYNEASGVPSLSASTISSIKINLPSKSEQSRIVTLIETWDEHLDLLDQKIALKKNVKKSLMRNLLSGKMRPSGFSDNWRSITLGEIGKVSMCKRIFKEQTSVSGGVPFYKIGTFGKSPDAYISQSLYDEYRQKYSFPNKGDILISASGTIGRTVVYDGEHAYFQDSNIIWIANDEKTVLNSFLHHAYKIVTWHTAHGTIARLYNDNVRRAALNVPSLDEQREIAKILDNADEEITSLTKKREYIAEQKKYLVNNLTSGKIRTPESFETKNKETVHA